MPLRVWIGKPPPKVKDQLGHSNIKIAVDTYGYLVPGANRQAVNRLPSLGGFQALKQKEKDRPEARPR